jgi:EmrB/QacA subfamily drug resistance transporter
MSRTELVSEAGPRAARSPWIPFSLLALVQFMVVLDAGIVYVALPTIQRELGYSEHGLAWVMDSYMLAFGGFMLLGGRAADLVGRRRLLMTGLGLFAVASLACGLSTEAWQLTTGRVLQGLAAAVVAPAAMAMVIDIFEEGPQRYKALGMFGGVGGLAGATGVLFGGLLTSIAWQWAFLINVPVVIGILFLAPRLLPTGTPAGSGRLDFPGALTGTGGLLLLLYAVLRGGALGWTRGEVVAGVIGGAALLVAFAVRQLRATHPLVPRALFRMRNVVLGNVLNTVGGALMFGVFYVISLYLQATRGYSPLEAALRTAPLSLAFFAGSQVAIQLVAKIRGGSLLAAGLGLQGVALLWWAGAASPDSNVALTVVLPGAVWGLGMGAIVVTAFVVCTSGLHGPVQGAASGLVSTTLQVGGACGIALCSAVGQDRALWVVGALALLAVPLALWLRASWQEEAHPAH